MTTQVKLYSISVVVFFIPLRCTTMIQISTYCIILYNSSEYLIFLSMFYPVPFFIVCWRRVSVVRMCSDVIVEFNIFF